MKYSRLALYLAAFAIAAVPSLAAAHSDGKCKESATCDLGSPDCFPTMAAEHARFLLAQQPVPVQDPQRLRQLRQQSLSTRGCLSPVAFAIVNQDGSKLASVGSSILEQAEIHKSNLPRVKFNNTDLKGASFAGSNLRRAVFTNADLTGASFDPLPSKGALPSADTSGSSTVLKRRALFCNSANAENFNTDLENAEFRGTDLSGASFSCARMAGVVFEPSTLPDAASIAYAQSLSELTYDRDQSPLIRLRQEFRDAGYARQDGELTYAIRRRSALKLREACSFRVVYPCIAYVGDKIAEISCAYGMNVLRPIEIGAAAWLIFAVIYFAFMHHTGTAGLYLAVADGIDLEPDAVRHAPPVRPRPVTGDSTWARARSWIADEFRLFRIACFFSLINGFNLGFREIDFGRWVHLLPHREFEFRALGWPRTVAGIQALFTFAIVALWVLIMIGHPFD